ncbi:MAG: tetratricopeptide repeat protein, partial [Treponema sp.]
MNRLGYPSLFKMKKEKYRIAVYPASWYNEYSPCLKWVAALVVFVLQSGFCTSLDLIGEGKRLLLSNNPDKAILVFRQAETEGAADPALDLYLGVAYLRAGQYADAEQRLSAGKAKDAARSYLYSYNLGNCYYMQNRFSEAESEYSIALDMRHSYSPAALNRANTRVQLQKYAEALEDYKLYITIEPVTPQTPMIREMIRVLEEGLHIPNDAETQETAVIIGSPMLTGTASNSAARNGSAAAATTGAASNAATHNGAAAVATTGAAGNSAAPNGAAAAATTGTASNAATHNGAAAAATTGAAGNSAAPNGGTAATTSAASNAATHNGATAAARNGGTTATTGAAGNSAA